MADIQQLQQLTASQGFARLTSDVELVVDMSDTSTRVIRADVGRVFKDGRPTDEIKTRERVDEDTGKVVVEAQVGVTVEVLQGGASAPIVLPKLWMSVDDAVAIVTAAQTHATCKVVGLRAVPYISRKQKPGSQFLSETPAVKWACDGIEL